MSNCTYCHAKAGLFKDAHRNCAQSADEARDGLRVLMTNTILSGDTPADLFPQIATLKKAGRLTENDAQFVMLTAADNASYKLALESPVSDENTDRISNLFTVLDENWHKDPTKLLKWSGYIALLHSNTIYEVLHKQIPYQNAAGFSDFRLQLDEHPILRRNVTLAEYKTVSNGHRFESVGMPIGGGMYYRIGASQPRTQHTALTPVDQGPMVITTKAIIFSGQQSNFRLPYSSILRLESFVDGFGVHENYGRGKVFIPALIGSIDEGWYFYNLVSALLKW